MSANRLRPTAPTVGDRIGPIGDWPDDSTWGWGEVVQASAPGIAIKTNDLETILVPMRRVVWRNGEWGAFGPNIDQLVQEIETHERTADRRRSKFNSAALILGDFVSIDVGGRMVGGFVRTIIPNGYICSVPASKGIVPKSGASTWMVTHDVLDWDDQEGCWVARYDDSNKATA